MKFAKFAVICFGVLLLLQIVPYDRSHTNPPRLTEPAWDSPGTRAFFFRACSDCHSNETSWPWYSSVAPVSWLVQRDVNNGRKHFNVSEWGPEKRHGDEAAGKVRDGDMPLRIYLPLHSEARLSPTERKEFIRGLERTFKISSDDAPEHSDHGDHEH